MIELRDKVGTDLSGTSLQIELDALEALKSLGYSQNEAREALKKVSSDTNTNTKIREALKVLGGKYEAYSGRAKISQGKHFYNF